MTSICVGQQEASHPRHRPPRISLQSLVRHHSDRHSGTHHHLALLLILILILLLVVLLPSLPALTFRFFRYHLCPVLISFIQRNNRRGA